MLGRFSLLNNILPIQNAYIYIMDVLSQMISNLSKEDLRFYKLFSSRHEMTEERQDLLLLDYIREHGDEYEEDELAERLYPGRDRNALYSLKNRLIHDVARSLTVQYCFKDNVLYIHHLLFLVRLYFMRSQFKLSLHFLKKAEKEARTIENYELLDVIYAHYIRLSHEILEINPEEFIKKREDARKLAASLIEMENILAVVYYRLKTSQNISTGKAEILPLLQKTIDTYSDDPSWKKSPRLRFRLYSIVSQFLLQRHDYINLENYLLTTWKEFTKEKFFNRDNHNVKLQMLHYLVNAKFKNKKYEESLECAADLKRGMEEFGGVLSEQFLFFYYNSLVINYSALDKDKAIAILDELIVQKTLKNQPFYELFIHLNLAILWFEKGDFHQAIRCMNRLYVHQEYKNADRSLQFKIRVAELLIRFELDDPEFLENRTKSLKKDFATLLRSGDGNKELLLIKILKRLAYTLSPKEDKKLMEYARELKKIPADDTEIIPYYHWLTGKIKSLK